MTDPVIALQQMARQPVGSGSMHLDVPARSTRAGHGLRQAGGAALAVLALGAAGAGVAYAARPLGEVAAGYIIEGQRQLRDHCLRSMPHGVR